MKYLLFVCFIIFGTAVRSQDKCGVEVSPEEVAYLDNLMSNNKKFRRDTRLNQSQIRIPVTFNLIRRSDGSGGLTESQANGVLNQLNSYYSNANLEFFILGGLNFIDDDDSFDFDAANEGVVAVGNDVPGAINIYFFNTLVSGGTRLCGYTRFPPSSDRVFVAYSCVVGETTLEHELGHYFTLFHTHGTTNQGTTDELVNGANCLTAGDRICDTAADPNLFGKVDANCNYTGNDVDLNGDIYSPETRNIMSYSRDACQDLFSAGQYERIRDGFENLRAYLDFESDDFTANFITDKIEICIDETVRFTGIGFGVSSWDWEFEGGVPSTSTDPNPVITFPEGGTFTIKLTASSGAGQIVELERSNLIKVNDPLGVAVNDEFTSSFDNMLPTEVSIRNQDQGFTFQFSDQDRNQSTTSGSVFVNNYDYFTENLGNRDELLSSYYITNGAKSIDISFDYAYAFRRGGIIIDDIIQAPTYDSLEIVMNAGCGGSDIVVFKSGGEDLATAESSNDAFIPANSDWNTLNLSYDIKQSSPDALLVKFRNISYNGNNIYIDNLSIAPNFNVDNPSNLRIFSANSDGITIRWSDNSTNEQQFVIERSVNNADFEIIATLPNNSTTFTDQDVANGNVYSYQIFAKGVEEFNSDVIGPITSDALAVTALIQLQQTEFSIFPNPITQGELNIMIPEGLNEEVDVSIYDALGRLKYNETFDKISGNTITISKEVGLGLHYVNVQAGNHSITNRIIIIN